MRLLRRLLVNIGAIVCTLLVLCGCLLCAIILTIVEKIAFTHYWLIEKVVNRHAPRHAPPLRRWRWLWL